MKIKLEKLTSVQNSSTTWKSGVDKAYEEAPTNPKELLYLQIISTAYLGIPIDFH